MTIVGTDHFTSFGAACNYYAAYQTYGSPGFVCGIVRKKLEYGEIHLGRPETTEGESLVLLDDGARYGIATHAE